VSARFALGWPSAGFYVLLGTHGLLGAILLWGWQRPPLDEVFDLLSRRELDAVVEYSPREVAVLQSSWDKHAGLGRALLGKSTVKFLEPTDSGWLSRRVAHLAVSPEADHSTALSFEGRGAPSDFPLVVTVRGAGADRRLELTQPKQPKVVEWLPSDLKLASILDVEVTAVQGNGAAAPGWAVRVTNSAAARETP